MKIFLSVLILIFSLQSWTKADDIRDFEIEGISVGDSLLDYFSEETIKKGIRKDRSYNDDTFYDVEIYNLDLSSEFSNLAFNLKRDDIVTVSCIKYHEGDHNYTDNLRVAVNKREFVEWLANKAYGN